MNLKLSFFFLLYRCLILITQFTHVLCYLIKVRSVVLRRQRATTTSAQRRRTSRSSRLCLPKERPIPSSLPIVIRTNVEHPRLLLVHGHIHSEESPGPAAHRHAALLPVPQDHLRLQRGVLIVVLLRPTQTRRSSRHD